MTPTMDDPKAGQGYGWSPEVQRKLVALCLRDPQVYGQLGPGVFDAALIGHLPLRPVAEEVFRACREGGGRPPSPEMAEQLVLERLRRIKPAQAELTRTELRLVLTAEVSDALLLRAKAAEVARHAALEQAVMRAAALVESGAAQNGRGPELVRMFEDALAVGRGSSALLELLRDEAGLLELLSQRPPRTRTGIAPLDRALEGGATPGLHVVAGDPKLGKTSFLTQVAVGGLRAGEAVWSVSCEVTLYALAARLAAAMTGMTKQEARTDPERTVRLVRAWRQTRGEFLVEYHPGATVAWMASRLRHLEAEGRRIGLVVVDYLDLMRAGRSHGDEGRRHELAEICQDLRTLGVEANVPIWTAKGVNRKAVSKAVVTKADLSECFDVAYIADNIFALCATEEERRRTEPGPDGRGEIRAPIVRLFYAAGREAEDEYTVAAFRRDNARQRWVELPGYGLPGKEEADGGAVPGGA